MNSFPHMPKPIHQLLPPTVSIPLKVARQWARTLLVLMDNAHYRSDNGHPFEHDNCSECEFVEEDVCMVAVAEIYDDLLKYI